MAGNRDGVHWKRGESRSARSQMQERMDTAENYVWKKMYKNKDRGILE